MVAQPRLRALFTSPRSRGEVGSLAIRVRGSSSKLVCLPNLRIEAPLTPTLSPQERGEGVHAMRWDNS